MSKYASTLHKVAGYYDYQFDFSHLVEDFRRLEHLRMLDIRGTRFSDVALQKLDNDARAIFCMLQVDQCDDLTFPRIGL